MTTWRRLLCRLGLHDWRITAEIDVPGTGFTEDPADYQCGGIDYQIYCLWCPRGYTEQKRGVWIRPKHQPMPARACSSNMRSAQEE
jgi:hypothetical protein